ncbi:hypothetical protein JCM6882_005221 [Rhodosporidiobolus microsporus]
MSSLSFTSPQAASKRSSPVPMGTRKSAGRAPSHGAWTKEPIYTPSTSSRSSHTRSTRSSPSPTPSLSSSPASSYVSLVTLGIRGPKGWRKSTEDISLAASEAVETASIVSSSTTSTLAESVEATPAVPTSSTAPTSFFASLSSSKVGRTLRSVASFFKDSTPVTKPTTSISVHKTGSSILASSRAEIVPPSTTAPQLNLDCAASSDLYPDFVLDDYDSLDLLHIIWGEIHPWQLTLDPAAFSPTPLRGYHLVHVPRAHPRFRLKDTIRRVPVCGGLFTRAAPFSSDGKPNERLTAVPSLRELCRPERLKPSEYGWLFELCKEVPQAYEGAVVDLFDPQEVFGTLRGRVPSS